MVFYIDLSYCNGCGNCQLACKDEYVENEWMPYSMPQPETGQFWIRLTQKTCGSAPKVRIDYMPVMCGHCDNAPCIDASENGAVYRRDDGIVIIDPERAKGQRQIADACPYHAVFWNEELDIPQKCTGCAHLLDNGYKLPRCVEACPTEAFRYGTEEELKDEITGADLLMPETGCRPNIYYRNIPGQFIAGLVYDPVKKEVVIGAKCRLVYGARVYETFTDDLGDFWFRDLAVGRYDLYIEAPGFRQKVYEGLRTDDCINLGDIALEQR